MVLGIEEFIKFYNHTANNIKERVQEEKNKGEDTYFCEKELAEAFENALRYKQLAEWLTELKEWRRVYGVCPSYEMCIPECKEGYNAQIAEYKRLLKSAVNDMNSNNFCHRFDSCKVCSKKYNISCDKKFQWRYTDRFERLIGDE